MSDAIKKALMNMDKAVSNAESALLKRQKMAAKPAAPAPGKPVMAGPVASPPDLFSVSQNHGLIGTGLGFDRNLLAKKLDMTIARVEQLLGEA